VQSRAFIAGPLIFLAALRHRCITATIVLLDVGRLIELGVRSRRALAAENLFLRKQLALFQERNVNYEGPTIPRVDDGDSGPNVHLARFLHSGPVHLALFRGRQEKTPRRAKAVADRPTKWRTCPVFSFRR